MGEIRPLNRLDKTLSLAFDYNYLFYAFVMCRVFRNAPLKTFRSVTVSS